jgi:hypothetical protein
MAKQYFAQRGGVCEARDMEQSPAAMEEFRKLGSRGLPLILVGAKKVEGFGSQALDAML